MFGAIYCSFPHITEKPQASHSNIWFTKMSKCTFIYYKMVVKFGEKFFKSYKSCTKAQKKYYWAYQCEYSDYQCSFWHDMNMTILEHVIYCSLASHVGRFLFSSTIWFNVAYLLFAILISTLHWGLHYLMTIMNYFVLHLLITKILMGHKYYSHFLLMRWTFSPLMLYI